MLNATFWTIFKHCDFCLFSSSDGDGQRLQFFTGPIPMLANRTSVVHQFYFRKLCKIQMTSAVTSHFLDQKYIHLYLIRFLILKKLPSLGTYIFEIYRSRAFQRGITRIHKLDFGWDGHSRPLKAIIKMSPDGANFLYKCL